MARRNLITNPSFEIDTNYWSGSNLKYALRQIQGTFATNTGAYTIDTRANVAGDVNIYQTPPLCPVTVGAVYSGSIYVFVGTAINVRIDLDWYSGDGTYMATDDITVSVAGGVTRISHTALAPAATGYGRLYVKFIGLADDAYVAVDGAMFEPGSTPGPYADGDTAGWEWDGTPHASTSRESVQAESGQTTTLVPVGDTLTATMTMAAAAMSDIPVRDVLVTTGPAPIELTPPPHRWQLLAGPASGGHELALTEARARKLVIKLTEPSECSFTLDGRHPQAAALGELASDVHVLYRPPTGPAMILYRGRVGASADALDTDSHTMTVASLDYRAVLARRILWSDSQLVWTATDQADIARGLLAQTQTRPGGDLGINPGTTLTGIVRDRTYEAGDSIGERIQELSQVLDGFDWDVTPVSASGLALELFHPYRGVDRGVVLEYGGLVTSIQRQVDPGAYANAIRMTGKEGTDTEPGPTPVELAAPDVATVDQGRWDKAFGKTSLETQAVLADRAAWQLAESQVIRPSYTLTLRPGAWEGPDHIWVGDTVRLVVYSGRLAVDSRLRVVEIGIDIADTGDETVSLTVGAPRPDFRRRGARIERRLNNLERR